MPAQDYGDLNDYIFNDDNWTKLQTDGSTLVIPGQYGHPALIPQPERDTYRELEQCSGDTAALIAHDIFTGFFYIVAIATFDAQVDTPECALAQSFEGPDCRGILQSMVDALAGRPLYQIFAPWLLIRHHHDSEPNRAAHSVLCCAGCWLCQWELPARLFRGPGRAGLLPAARSASASRHPQSGRADYGT